MNYQHLDRTDALAMLAEATVLHRTEDDSHVVYTLQLSERDFLMSVCRSTGRALLIDGDDAAYGGSTHQHVARAATTGALEPPRAGASVLEDLLTKLGCTAPTVALEDVPQSVVDELNKVYILDLEGYCAELSRCRMIEVFDFGSSEVRYALRDDGEPIVFVQCAASDLNLVIMPASTA